MDNTKPGPWGPLTSLYDRGCFRVRHTPASACFWHEVRRRRGDLLPKRARTVFEMLGLDNPRWLAVSGDYSDSGARQRLERQQTEWDAAVDEHGGADEAAFAVFARRKGDAANVRDTQVVAQRRLRSGSAGVSAIVARRRGAQR